MLRSFQNLKWREAVPRIVADFTIVHLSMIIALAISVMYRIAMGHGTDAQQFVGEFTEYYRAFFWLLSPIFPVIFLFNGFYTHSRSYLGKYKALVIVRGVIVAMMLFLTANFLLFGTEIIGRSVAVPFMIVAAFGLCSTRLFKALFEKHYDVKPRNDVFVRNRHSRVLVVGGAGYIGSLLVERLLEMHYNVRVLDRLVYGDEALRPVKDNPDFELMVGDCRNIQDVVKAVRGVESIIHLAAIVGDLACDQDRASALEVNYAATRMLIEIAKGNGVSRLVFASSCSVYGATDCEVDEGSAVSPISLYGQTKVDSEEALLAARTETFHPTILRFATVFGLSHRPRFDLVVNLLAAKASQDGVVTIFNGHQWRPFLHVRDVAEAVARVLDAPARLVGGEVFNIGDSRLNYTLSDIAEIVGEVFPETRIEHIENDDRRNYRVSFDKCQQRIGFRARYSIQDGLQELKKAFEWGLIADYTDLRYHNQRFLKAAGSPENKNELDAQVMAAFAGVPMNGPATVGTNSAAAAVSVARS